MPLDKGKLQKLYSTLQQGGYSQSYAEFEKGFTGNENYANRKKVYDLLTEHGADIGSSYEEFMKKMYTPAASSPALSYSQQRTQAPAPKPTPRPKPKGGGMTAAQKAAFIRNAQNIVHSSAAGLQHVENQMDYANGNRGLKVRPVHLGQNSKVVRRHANGTVAKPRPVFDVAPEQQPGDTYLTESGNEYGSRAEADTEQNAVDQYRYDQSETGQLNNAYAEAERLDQLLEQRGKELDSENEGKWWRDMPRGGGGAVSTMNANDNNGRMTDTEYLNLLAARKKVDEQIRDLKAARDEKTGTFLGGLWRGFRDYAFDLSNWDNGYRDLLTTSAMLRAKTGAAQTPREKASERMMMEDTYKAGEAAEKAEKVLGNGYRFMRIGAQSLPFALQFMAGNAMGMTGGIARAGEGMGVKLARKIAIKQGANNMLRNIGRSVLKNTGVMLGDLGAATALTTTIQAGQTGADIGQRYVGDVAYDPKTDDYKLEGGKSLGRSIYEGVANSAIENYTEMLGEHMHLGKFASSALTKVGLGKVSNWFTKVGKTDFMQGVNKYMKMAGFNGYPQEVMEEEVGIPLHAIFDGGNKMSDLLDGRQQLDIVGGMLFSMAGMGGASMAMQGGHKAAMAVQYHQDQHKLDNADKVASFRLTADKWAPIKDEIDGTTNEDFGKTMKNVLSNDELSDQEKQAVWDYAQRLIIMRGHNMGQEAATRNGMTDKETNTANESYTQGYNTTDATAMNDAKNRLAAAQAKFDEAMKKEGVETWEGHPDMQDIQHRHHDADEVLNMKWADGSLIYEEGDPIRKLAQDVVNAQQEYEGMMQRVRDDIDDEVQQTSVMYDQRTNPQTGMIQSATLEAQNPDGTDKKVYIISGNIVMTDDGKSVDRQKSDMSVVVVDDEGKVQMISPEDIFSLDTPIDGTQAKQQAIDAIQQSKAQEAADKINGKVDYTAGNTYTLTDSKGQQIEATLVADQQTGAVENPDGSVNVSMGGKVVPMAKETFQQMVDNTNMQRTAQGDEEAAAAQQSDDAAAQQQPTEQSDENGNVDASEEGSAVPSYPGSVVAPSEPHQWQMDDTFVIDNGGVPVRGQVTGIDADGVEIYTESPINGKKMQVISPEELQSKVSEINGKAVGVEQEDAAAQQQPTEQSGVNGEQAQEQAPQTQEQAQPQQTEEAQGQQTEEAQEPQRAIDRIPSHDVDDGKGKVRTVHDWEQAEPGDTYDALSEIYHGNADRVKKGVQNRITAIDKQIKAIQKQMDAIDNSDDFDAVAAQGDKYDQLQQQKAALEQQKKYWQGVQNVPVSRRAEQDKRTEEEKAAAKAARQQADQEAIEKARQERERVNGVPDVINDTPSDARQRGFRNVNGMVVNRQGNTEGVTGRESSVKFSSKDTAKGKVKVIEADQLQPSHVNGQRNPQFFIDEAQPKDRTDTVSSMAAAKIASNLNPEEITGDGSAYQFSAPTVNSRGEVIQGNNRSDALKLMYSTPAFKPAQDAYKQYIIDHAADFGFTPEDVERIKQMQHPVMVNELGVDDDEAIRLGQMKASDNESGGIERIDPVTTSQKLGAKVGSYANILLSSPDEDASLSDVLMQNGAKTVHWLSSNGIISNTAAQSAFDRKGNLTPEARMDLLNILKQSLFQGGVSDLPAMFDKMPAKAQKAILNTFMRDFDSAESERILPEIQKAIEAWYGCAMSNEAFAKAPNYKAAKAAMHDWTLQTNLLDDNMSSDKFSNFAMELACRLQGCSMRETQQSLNDFFDLVQGKSQGDLFGGTTMGEQADRQESIRRIFNIEYKPISNNNGKTGSNAMADDNSQSGEGRPGSTGDGAGRERAAGAEQHADVAGGTEGNDEKGINAGAIRTKDGGYKKLPTGYAYRITDAQEVQDVIDNGMFRKMPDDMIVPGSNKVYTSKSGRKFSFGKQAGNTHGGKAFAAGMPWGDNGNGGTTSGGSGEKYFIAIPGNNIDGWRVGHHGHYSEPRPFDEIEEGKGLWLPFDEDGDVADLSTDGMRVFKKVGDTYYEVEHPEDIANNATQQTAQPIGSTSSQEHVESERESVNTEPTEKQKEAGNYKKGHIKVDGYDITIENPKGSTRSGKDASGKAWSVPMHYDYGYIKGTEGVDGDHIDVYLSDNPTSGNVYVVDQINQKDGSFDEHKVMYGFPSMEAARKAYASQYEKGWKIGKITEVSREDFKKWVDSSVRKTKPFADYKSMKDAAINGSAQNHTEKAETKKAKTATEPKRKPKQKPKVKPKENKNEGEFGLVSDARMEELKKRLRAKLNNLNMGVDPEVLAIGLELAVGHIDRGIKKFADFAKVMIDDLGDAVRPYLKAFYNGARDMPELTETGLDKQMDDYDTVSRFNIASIGKEGEDVHPSPLDTAEQISNEQTVQEKADKEMEIHEVDVMSLFGDLNRGRTTSLNEHNKDNDEDAAIKAAHDNLMRQLDEIEHERGQKGIDQMLKERDNAIDFYKERLDKGETSGPSKELPDMKVDYGRTLARAIGERQALQEFIDNGYSSKAPKQHSNPSSNDLVRAAQETGHLVIGGVPSEADDGKVHYDEKTGRWSGVPDNIHVNPLYNERGREPHAISLQANDRIEFIHGRYSGDVVRVHVYDENAETPAAIRKKLETEGYEVSTNNYSSGYVDFESYKDADAFAKHVDEVQNEVDKERAEKAALPQGEGMHGYTLRKATGADFDNGHPPVYIEGQRHFVVMLVRKGEQIGVATFSKPVIERLVLDNGDSVPFDKAYVEDVPTDINLKTVGDFYEAYGNDAVALGMYAGLTVTERHGHKMAGFPKNDLGEYEDNMLENGFDIRVDGELTPKSLQAEKDAAHAEEQKPVQKPSKKTASSEKNNAGTGKKTTKKGNRSKKNSVSLGSGTQLDLFGNNEQESQQQPSLFDKPAEVTEGELKGEEKPVEVKPESEISGDSAEYQKKAKAEQDFVKELKDTIDNIAEGWDDDITMADVKKMAKKYPEIADYSDTDLQELVERAVAVRAREIAIPALWAYTGNMIKEEQSKLVKRGYDDIVELYKAQPTLNARDSTRVERQQYSTPIPFGYVMDMFLGGGMRKPVNGLEPSAGNGALTIGFPAAIWHVNDIDDRRLENLRTMGFRVVTNQDGTQPFESKAYDMVATNPPFGSTDQRTFDGGRTKISSLEGLMAINALESMKDDGRAAIIIGGNTEYRDNGVMQAKDMQLFRHLYTHYNVVDVINLDGDMYKRNGTGYNVRMILINGRKNVGENPEKLTIPPVRAKARAEQVKTFDELYNRVYDDIQRAKLAERDQPATTVNRDESNGGRSAQVSTGNNQPAVSGTRQQPVRGGSTRGGAQLSEHASSSGNGGKSEQPTKQANVRGLDNDNRGNGASASNLQQNRPAESRGAEQRGSGVTERGSERADNSGNTVVGANSNVARASVKTPEAHADNNTNTQEETEPEKIQLGQEKVAYPAKSKSMRLMSRVPANQAEAIKRNLDKLGDVDAMVRNELGYSSKDELFSHLAAEQIDGVALAIHQMKLGNGFIIGDQTGIGKGRQGAAMIRWAVRQGKTPVYFTQKSRLYTDNYRDLKDIGSSNLLPFIIASNSDANITEEVLDKNGNKVYKENGEVQTRIVHKLPSKAEQQRVFDYILQNHKLPDEYDYVLCTYSQVANGTQKFEIGKDGDIEVNDKEYKGKGPTANDKNGDGRRRVIEQLVKDNYVILDESHTAGGQSNTGLFLQRALKDAKGITYMSATFAKAAGNMPLYAMKTAMSDSGLSQGQLIKAIQKGGVTLQEIMSKQLVESGQYIRRERDFSGVTIDWKGVDEITDKKQREQFDEVASIFTAIREFQDNYVKPCIAVMSDTVADEGSYAGVQQGTEHMGVNNVPFASKMFNLVNQLLFSLKVDAVADEAIRILQKPGDAKEKPIISFTNTMEGFLDELPKNTPLDKMPDFSMTLLRALDGVMRYTVTDADLNKQNGKLRLSELGEEGEREYNNIRKRILNMSSNLPICPLDAIRIKIEDAGFKMGEISGRKSMLIKRPDGKYEVKTRDDKKGKETAAAFNNGQLDGVMINKAGATGISLQASPKFDDTHVRNMIAAQFQSDINDEIQMRGRNDRTGQIHRGKYTYIVSSIPAEQRLQMMFKNKLKSLDANTTSSQKSKFNEMEVTDFMNKYGDEVTYNYMMEHPDLEEKLGDPLKMLTSDFEGNTEVDENASEKKNRFAKEGEDDSPKAGAAGKVLRRLPFLSVKEQEEIFNDLADAYKVKIQLLNDAGENDLEITTMPLRAETKDRKIWKEGTDPDSGNAFADNTYVEMAEVDVLKKPMKADEIRTYASKLTDGKPWDEYKAEKLKEIDAYFDAKRKTVHDKFQASAERRADKKREKYVQDSIEARAKGKNDWSDEYIRHMADIQRKESIDGEQKKIQDQVKKVDYLKGLWHEAFSEVRPLTFYVVPMSWEESQANAVGSATSPGVFLGFRINKGFSLSSSTAVFATLDGRRKVEFPINGRELATVMGTTKYQPNEIKGISLDNWDSKVPNQSRQLAFIITGNLMQALADTEDEDSGIKGNLVSYTTLDGEVKQGILMNERFKITDLKADVPINTRYKQIVEGNKVESKDGEVSIEKQRGYYGSSNMYELKVPKSKAKGGKYFLNKKLRKLVQGDFQTKGGNMVAQVWEDNLKKVLNCLSNDLGVTVQEQAKLTDDKSSKKAEKDDKTLFRTSDELNDEYGSRWLDEQTNEDGRHTTQVKNTIRSYEKFGEWVKKDSEGRDVDVLDASSGLGLGTQWMRENGINADDVEPYPSENREQPTYTSYDEINKKYDYIISNAVLNVIPDDWRAALLHNMADKLKVGGKMVINVRSAQSIANQGKEGETRVTLDSPAEILVKRPNGSIKAYQRGFTKDELRDWCQDELGDGYSVAIANKDNAGGSYDTAVVVTKRSDTQEREGNGAYTDDEVSYANDPWQKMGLRRSAAERRAFAQRERLHMADAVDELAQKMHLDNVAIVTEAPESDHSRRARAKGYYDRATHQIVVNVYNHATVSDAVATLLHEGVAHYGLRQLFGTHFDDFIYNVYAAADKDVRRRITDLAMRKYNGDFGVATEEYLASLAEDTNFENMPYTFWSKIKRLFLDMLHAIGFKDYDVLGIKLGDNELRYILWRSYKNLTDPDSRSSILGEAEDIDRQLALHLGRLASKNRAESGSVQSDEEKAAERRAQAVSRISRRVVDTYKNYQKALHDMLEFEKKSPEEQDKEEEIADQIIEAMNKANDMMGAAKDAAFVYNIDIPKLLREAGLDPYDYHHHFMGESSEQASEPEAWGKRDLASKAKQVSNGIDPQLLFRDSIEDEDDTARETYNRMADADYMKWREAWQDSMINVRNLQQAVLDQEKNSDEAVGDGKLKDWEDAYNAENRSHGKSRAESEYFTDNLYKPLLKAVNAVAKAAKVSVGDVTEYMMAKHGLERNVVFASRDAQKAYDKAQQKAQEEYDALMNAAQAESDPKKKDALEKRAQKVKFPDYNDLYLHFRQRDYSGLTALTGQSDAQDAEVEAQRIVTDMESKAAVNGGAQNGLIDELWKATNAATEWTLRKAYESGMMSRDNYDYVRSMFNNYIPLRGWEEDTAGDLYDYVGSGDKGTAFSPTLHKAKGRRSQADNPIAYIGSMAVSSIVQGNKNKVKQTFMRFAENHPTNLVTVSEMWYRNFGTDTAPDWREDVPYIPEDATADEIAAIVKQHEDDMEQLEAQGMATKQRGRLHLGVPVKKGQALEHHVEVMVNGKKYVLYINGNPRAAQALNGTRMRRSSERSFESSKIATIGRKLSERYTSLSPSFTVSNMFRDLTMAAISTAIKENPAYALRFRLNVARLGGPARMFPLMRWYRKAVAEQLPTGQMSGIKRYFYEFMTQGAETGFTSLKEIDTYKDDMQKMYKHMNQSLSNPKRLLRGLSEGLKYTNRCIEDMTRFATYMTSRQSGRSVRESVSDAKNITLNFNRKGSGELGNSTYRNLQIFVNPAIQSLQNVASMAMDHPVKFSLYTGMVALIGAAQVFATQLLWSMFGGGDGDDDNWNAVDEYWKLPTWQRRNNLVMWIPGTKKFAMIPLAQEFRVFHGFGETLTTTLQGKSDESPALELMSQTADLLPLDFAGNNGNMLVNLAPTVVQPLLQVRFNTDFTGRPLYKDTGFNKYEPSFQKAYVGTPSWLVKSSEFLNDLTGGDDHKQGWWERTNIGQYANNPAVVDHLLKGYYGGMYSFFAQTGGAMLTAASGKLPDVQEVPVANRVVTAVRETEPSGKQKLPDWYYDLSEENDRHQNEFSGYKKDYMTGDADGKKKFNALIKSKDFAKWQEVNTYIGAVQQIRTAMSYTKDPAEKAELQKNLDEVLAELKKLKDK